MSNNGYLKDLITPADQILVGENSTFKDAVALINNTHSGIALVVDKGKTVGRICSQDNGQKPCHRFNGLYKRGNMQEFCR